jgi:hypothetical protein
MFRSFQFFFHAQEDKISQYEAWKDLDLKLRREYRTEPTKFNINHYAAKYEAAKTTFELKALIKKQTLNGVKDLPYRRDNSYRQPYRGTCSRMVLVHHPGES